jgi:hypothetical protein
MEKGGLATATVVIHGFVVVVVIIVSTPARS